jgi:DNA-binding transcriptional LysR family regulator
MPVCAAAVVVCGVVSLYAECMTAPPPITMDRIEMMRTFVRIVEAGSLSAAAAQLRTSQPTVSRRLQLLERTLGLRLVQRSTHGLKLTDDGERCFVYAKGLLEDWSAMEADLRGARDEPRGVLRILAPHAFGQDQLVTPLAEFLSDFPNVAVEWLLHDRRPDFIAEGIDCAIQVGVVEDPTVVALRVADVPRIVVAAPGLWGEGPPPTEAQTLVALPWLALNTFYRNEVTLAHQSDSRVHSFAIRPRLSTDSLYALRNAALLGVGVAIASAWAVAADLESGQLVRLVPDWQAAPLPVYLVYPQARFYPAKLRRFIDLMRVRIPPLFGMRAVGHGGS